MAIADNSPVQSGEKLLCYSLVYVSVAPAFPM